MSTLSESLLDPARRPEAVKAIAGVVESEISGKSGLSGAAIKTAFAAATKMRPGIVPAAVDGLLPDLATTLQPYWDSKGDQPFGAHLAANGEEVADKILAVSDAKVESPDAAKYGKIYKSFRPKAKSNMVEALPALGATIESLV